MRKSSVAALKMLFAGLFLGIACLASAQNTVRGTVKDENGIADVRYMAEKGYVVQATTRQFNPARDYLWPIPAADRLINENLTQNPGY